MHPNACSFLEFRAVFCCNDIKTSNVITIDCLKVKQLQCSFGKFTSADVKVGLGDKTMIIMIDHIIFK